MRKKQFIILFCSLFLALSAQARMYKWLDENGKVHFTNTAPPSNAKQVSASHESVSEPESPGAEVGTDGSGSGSQTGQNQFSPAPSETVQQKEASPEVSVDPRCAELLNELNKVKPDNINTFGDIMRYKAQRKAITDEYELRCMSSGDRQAKEQTREMKQLNNQMRQIQNKQQEISERQQGIRY